MFMKNKINSNSLLYAIAFFVILCGSVFIVSGPHLDLCSIIKMYWTLILGSLYLLVYSIHKTVGNNTVYINHEQILYSIILVGALECVYSFLQIIKIIPSYNSFFNYTGSFENPAIFAMILSVCIPICAWFTFQRKKKYIWVILGLGMFIFTAFSESRTGLLATIGSVAVIGFMESHTIRRLVINKYAVVAIVLLLAVLFSYLYYFKADSANGRLLIWQVSISMLRDKPLLGWGPKGFSSMYMVYQAQYLSSHPDSPFLLLADNPSVPFNEFILVLINYGIVGLTILLTITVVIVIRILKSDYKHKSLLIGLLYTVMIWGFFSYPTSVPFVWIITSYILVCSIICSRDVKKRNYVGLGIISLSLLFFSIYRFFPDYRWKVVSEKSINGECEEMLPFFKQLSVKQSNSADFIYNWAAELHYAKHYEESAEVFNNNMHILNDYNVQMLLADDYQQLGDMMLALEHYDEAARMVPSRFLPHYYKMNLYLETGDTAKAVQMAEQIINKDIKVDKSGSVKKIRKEATELLNMYY